MKYLFADSSLAGPWKMLYTDLWRHLPVPILNLLEFIPSKEKRRWTKFGSMTQGITRNLLNSKLQSGALDDSKDILSVLGISSFT